MIPSSRSHPHSSLAPAQLILLLYLQIPQGEIRRRDHLTGSVIALWTPSFGHSEPNGFSLRFQGLSFSVWFVSLRKVEMTEASKVRFSKCPFQGSLLKSSWRAWRTKGRRKRSRSPQAHSATSACPSIMDGFMHGPSIWLGTGILVDGTCSTVGFGH
jgi:hypothetical protein